MILTTERLTLRPLTVEDAAAVHAFMSDPEVCRYTFDGPWSLEETTAFLTTIDPPHAGHEEYAVIERATGDVIGVAGCEPYGAGQSEVGWILGRDRWRQGYGKEAARAIIAYASGLPGITEIVGRCHVENAASAALMARVGMTFIRIIQGDTRRGTVRDSRLYSIPAAAASRDDG
ncbi:MAG: GNAT family N-acetyltransferase [Demequinaceae bacterium]|nr:GNAT family N-acetyltransferase [Demequinaceae bacterium]